MPLIENTANYDEKEPTNIRLEKDLKDKVIQDAEDKGTNMAKIVNDILRNHYKK